MISLKFFHEQLNKHNHKNINFRINSSGQSGSLDRKYWVQQGAQELPIGILRAPERRRTRDDKKSTATETAASTR